VVNAVYRNARTVTIFLSGARFNCTIEGGEATLLPHQDGGEGTLPHKMTAHERAT